MEICRTLGIWRATRSKIPQISTSQLTFSEKNVPRRFDLEGATLPGAFLGGEDEVGGMAGLESPAGDFPEAARLRFPDTDLTKSR